jgi:hypothetical protein
MVIIIGSYDPNFLTQTFKGGNHHNYSIYLSICLSVVFFNNILLLINYIKRDDGNILVEIENIF